MENPNSRLTALTARAIRVMYRQGFVMFCSFLLFVPGTGAMAEEGYLVMQYEMSLAKQPKFRQLNLSYQDRSGLTSGFGNWTPHQQRMHVPLYSNSPYVRGLFNRLEEGEEGQQDQGGGSGTTFGDVVRTALGIAVIGAYLYALGKCVHEAWEDFPSTEKNEDETSCD